MSRPAVAHMLITVVSVGAFTDANFDAQFVRIGEGGCRPASDEAVSRTFRYYGDLNSCFEGCLASWGGDVCVALKFKKGQICELYQEEIVQVSGDEDGNEVCFSRVFDTTNMAVRNSPTIENADADGEVERVVEEGDTTSTITSTTTTTTVTTTSTSASTTTSTTTSTTNGEEDGGIGGYGEEDEGVVEGDYGEYGGGDGEGEGEGEVTTTTTTTTINEGLNVVFFSVIVGGGVVVLCCCLCAVCLCRRKCRCCCCCCCRSRRKNVKAIQNNVADERGKNMIVESTGAETLSFAERMKHAARQAVRESLEEVNSSANKV